MNLKSHVKRTESPDKKITKIESETGEKQWDENWVKEKKKLDVKITSWDSMDS